MATCWRSGRTSCPRPASTGTCTSIRRTARLESGPIVRRAERRKGQCRPVAAVGILDDLPLLLHAVRLERLSGLEPVVVGAPAHPECPVQQLAELRGDAARVVAPGAPRLVLAAVGQLVRENGQVARAALWQEHVVAERHRPTAA